MFKQITIMKTRLLAVALVGPWCLAAPGLAAPVDSFNVVWDSPSANHHGSMPLGNGDITLNAWMTGNGELQFYIGKSDAWGDNARLLKVGKVRIQFEPGLLATGGAFRQELKLREGCMEIVTRAAEDSPSGSHRDQSRVRVWVDANHPVIHVTAESSAPLTATATIELWRTNRQTLRELQVSDVLMEQPTNRQPQLVTVVEPDTVWAGQAGRIGWFHHNVKSLGPELLAEIQGLTGFPQADPLLHRTFGAVITATGGERVDDLHLRSPQGVKHQFSVYVLTRHPATPPQWQKDMEALIAEVAGQDFAMRQREHARWWHEFWERSWIRASSGTDTGAGGAPAVPRSSHPVRIGSDQDGGNRFAGELGRVTVLDGPLTEAQIAAVARAGRRTTAWGGLAVPPAPAAPQMLFTGSPATPQILAGSRNWDFASGLTVEAWVKPRALGSGGARIVDKLTPGQRDGFLLDTYPGNSLRFICGEVELTSNAAVPPDQWTHVAAVMDATAHQARLYVNGSLKAQSSPSAGRDPAAYVSQMYHLQRFITACAGRGAFPIKFNGSLFTVPPGATENDPDYRRWGPGYWWQNTRLPYISLCTSGDFDLQRPLFRMYAEQLLPLCQYRTRHYLGHGGAFYPECLMFWGAMFSETYGWTPFAQRTDKLQASGWHKWEWVGGIELAWMMLDYYDHTLDREFLTRSALPLAHEILTFFDEHYPTNAQGKLVMYPSQALETWWRCTNAAPELAGCLALTERLRAMPPELVDGAERAFCERLHAKLPPLPLHQINGRTALAPAEFFADKRNIENPELYAVFPFRQFAFNRPHRDWALTALEHRGDRGHIGWRQDDIFTAYLGLVDETRDAIVSRARSHDRNERFPAFWGPNFDWTPDQDHGGVLMKTFQAMLLQADGDKIYLLPAWPKDWDVEFKLHAPRQTVVAGVYRHGRLESLRVQPAARRADVVYPAR